jgi:hypothetical protein
MPPLLHVNAQITCPHGGMATVIPSQTRVTVSGMPVATLADTFVVAGCAFNVGGGPSPCLKIQWITPATRVTVQGAPVILQSSTGLGQNAAMAPQGPALAAGAQPRAQGV